MAGALRRISGGAPTEALAQMTGKYLPDMADDPGSDDDDDGGAAVCAATWACAA
jgi:hypothetical protein